MTLAGGQSLSFYEILGPIGAGGMGEVYRARDTRLDREVAVKVLPEALAADEDRLRRFEREAKTLASLNHANLAHVYGIDQVDDTCFMVMELVPGEDLGAVLARGALPVDDAIAVCRQIAEGLEAAHEAGVIHRDLKPANVVLTPEGRVKVLDFGLAKLLRGDDGGESSSAAQPDSFLVTEEGMVLGTPTYMSPEQARGRPVDRRTDVWSFGCVLFECLTGKPVFGGDAVVDVLAAIVEREPDFDALPSSVPERVVDLLARTLVKDPRQRLQHLGDARIELESARQHSRARSRSEAISPVRAGRGRWLAAGAVGLVLGAGLMSRLAEAPPPPVSDTPSFLSVALGSVVTEIYPRSSPDGRSVVFARPDPLADNDDWVLYLRRLDSPDVVRLPGTERTTTLTFSQDGSSICVVVADERGSDRYDMVRVILDEGTPRTVPFGRFAEHPNLSGGVTWTDQDVIVSTGTGRTLLTRPVEEDTWSVLPLVGLEGPSPYTPDVFRSLPGGRHVLAHTFAYTDDGFEAEAVAIEVETGVVTKLAKGGFPTFVEPNHLVFTVRDELQTIVFDPVTLETQGSPRVVLDGLRTPEPWRPAWFDFSSSGTLTYAPGGRQGEQRSFVFVEPDGQLRPWTDSTFSIDGFLRIARGGSFFVVGIASPSGLLEVWGSELSRPLLRPLSSEPRSDHMPAALDLDGRWIYYTRLAHGEPDSVWRVSLDDLNRSERVYLAQDENWDLFGFDASADGERMFIRAAGDTDISLISVDTDPATMDAPEHVIDLSRETWSMRASPDTDFVAYSTVIGGRRHVVVRENRGDGSWGPVVLAPFPAGELIDHAVWMDRGEDQPLTLLGVTEDDKRVWAVDILGSGTPSFSDPRLHVELDSGLLQDLEPMPNGRMLAVMRASEERRVNRVEVVLDAKALLER